MEPPPWAAPPERHISAALEWTDGTSESVRIDEPAKSCYRLGRNQKCCIVLDDATASRLHAFIAHHKNGGLFLVDLESANGTFLDGEKLKANVLYPLSNDAIITFGENKIEYKVKLVDKRDGAKRDVVEMLSGYEKSPSLERERGSEEDVEGRKEKLLDALQRNERGGGGDSRGNRDRRDSERNRRDGREHDDRRDRRDGGWEGDGRRGNGGGGDRREGRDEARRNMDGDRGSGWGGSRDWDGDSGKAGGGDWNPVRGRGGGDRDGRDGRWGGERSSDRDRRQGEDRGSGRIPNDRHQGIGGREQGRNEERDTARSKKGSRSRSRDRGKGKAHDAHGSRSRSRDRGKGKAHDAHGSRSRSRDVGKGKAHDARGRWGRSVSRSSSRSGSSRSRSSSVEEKEGSREGEMHRGRRDATNQGRDRTKGGAPEGDRADRPSKKSRFSDAVLAANTQYAAQGISAGMPGPGTGSGVSMPHPGRGVPPPPNSAPAAVRATPTVGSMKPAVPTGSGVSAVAQKRKLLWGTKDSQTNTATWSSMSSTLGNSDAQDKFMKLMGGKKPGNEAGEGAGTSGSGPDFRSMQTNLEREFQGAVRRGGGSRGGLG